MPRQLSSYLQYVYTLNNDHHNASATLCMLLSPQPLSAGVRSISGAVCTTNFRKLWAASPSPQGSGSSNGVQVGSCWGIPSPAPTPQDPEVPAQGLWLRPACPARTSSSVPPPKTPFPTFPPAGNQTERQQNRTKPTIFLGILPPGSWGTARDAPCLGDRRGGREEDAAGLTGNPTRAGLGPGTPIQAPGSPLRPWGCSSAPLIP